MADVTFLHKALNGYLKVELTKYLIFYFRVRLLHCQGFGRYEAEEELC